MSSPNQDALPPSGGERDVALTTTPAYPYGSGSLARLYGRVEPRNRAVYAALLIAVIVLGLGSRRFHALLPSLLRKNTGDVLWATAVFLFCGFAAPRISTRRAVVIAAVVSLVVEFSKRASAPWLAAIRHTLVGRLLLGTTFSWSNVVCYLIGVGIGATLEVGIIAYSAGNAQRAGRRGQTRVD